MWSSFKIYNSYEDFERDELRRLERPEVSVSEMVEEAFGGELDFEGSPCNRRSRDDEESSEEGEEGEIASPRRLTTARPLRAVAGSTGRRPSPRRR